MTLNKRLLYVEARASLRLNRILVRQFMSQHTVDTST